MATLMLQFKHAGTPPSLADVREVFGLGAGELDTTFGVVATDPAASLYTVLVDETAQARVRQRLAARPGAPGEGLFSNPTVAPTDDRADG